MKNYKLNNNNLKNKIKKNKIKKNKENKIYWYITIIILIFILICFLYYLPINFMKFISWLGNS